MWEEVVAGRDTPKHCACRRSYSSTCLRRVPHSRTTRSSSARILSELETRALLFSSRSCLCKSLLLLQFWAYPRFFKVLRFCLSLTTSSLDTPCSRLFSSLTLRLTSCWLLMIADSSHRIVSSAPGSATSPNSSPSVG